MHKFKIGDYVKIIRPDYRSSYCAGIIVKQTFFESMFSYEVKLLGKNEYPGVWFETSLERISEDEAFLFVLEQ